MKGVVKMYIHGWIIVALCLGLILALSSLVFYLGGHLVFKKAGWLKRCRDGRWVTIKHNIAFVNDIVNGVYHSSASCPWYKAWHRVDLYDGIHVFDFTVLIEASGDEGFYYRNPEDMMCLLMCTATIWADARSCLGDLDDDDDRFWKDMLISRIKQCADLDGGYKVCRFSYSIYGYGLEWDVSGSYE